MSNHPRCNLFSGNRLPVVSVVCLTLLLTSGCGDNGEFSLFGSDESSSNASAKSSPVDIMLDGNLAQVDTKFEPSEGFARVHLREPVSTTPTLEFRFKDSARAETVDRVILNIFKRNGDDVSSAADFAVFSRENSRDKQFKPGVSYALGDLSAPFGATNRQNDFVDGVTLDANQEYLMNVVFTADQAMTIQVAFATK